MATQISGAGGTTTSFSNTPQAQDDLLTVTASGIPLTEDLTGVLKLNVLANDSGGAAKTLWSVDDASGSTGTSTNGNTYPTDLLTKDVTYTTDTAGLAGTSDTSSMGAKIWIGSDGYVHYDTTGVAAQLQALGAGEYFTDTFTYAIKLGNGTLSWATATVRIAGTNDAPDIHLVTSDSAAASLNETNAPLTAGGTLTVTDPDLSDTVATAVDSVSLGGTTGGLTSNDVLSMLSLSSPSLAADPSDTHNLGWTFSSTPQAFDFLAAGETLTLTYTIKANDGHGGTDTQTVTITIHGTNDAPVITSAAQSGNVSEGDGLAASAQQASGQVTFSDVDASDSHTLSVSVGAAYGTASVDPDGTWHYTVSDSGAVDALAVGEHLA
ncbi:VCBS repeat-containing protein, partial [Mesorhizobium shonense]